MALCPLNPAGGEPTFKWKCLKIGRPLSCVHMNIRHYLVLEVGKGLLILRNCHGVHGVDVCVHHKT